MKSEIAKANIESVEVINNRLQENHKPYVFLEAIYFKDDESFTVFVGYDNWPNSEHCFSYEPIFKTKDDLHFTDMLLHSFTRTALSINEKEDERRTERRARSR
ncbi:transposase [Burkholderia multivorans]|uniref:transposase n=1 Tax=Burkholderia multivorans TaxID=87883 RepID=UPI001C238641|nr:transposase [Burkholderia multivorans]MBU9118373.1 transposase [Burkholderia multivorans]